MTSQRVLAIAAHPDDIEFVMAGTLLQLALKGWQVHYFNIANGCCGSKTLSRRDCAAVRLEEARRAAETLSATFHPPICDDMEIFYQSSILARVASVVRQAAPNIILTHSLADYMEDHQNAARLAVGAAFTRAMPGIATDPPNLPFQHDVAIYHAQPHGNRDPMGCLVQPTHFVDVTGFIQKKRELLSIHASQDQWLEATQRISAYLDSMQEFNREVGKMSRLVAQSKNREPYQYAEGWRQHWQLGFSDAGYDPLAESLADCIMRDV